jgi:hypothetical protein
LDNAVGSRQSVGLTGAGMDFSIALAPGGSGTATVSAGSPATDSLQIKPSGGTPAGNYTLTITGSSNSVSRSQTLILTVN